MRLFPGKKRKRAKDDIQASSDISMRPTKNAKHATAKEDVATLLSAELAIFRAAGTFTKLPEYLKAVLKSGAVQTAVEALCESFSVGPNVGFNSTGLIVATRPGFLTDEDNELLDSAEVGLFRAANKVFALPQHLKATLVSGDVRTSIETLHAMFAINKSLDETAASMETDVIALTALETQQEELPNLPSAVEPPTRSQELSVRQGMLVMSDDDDDDEPPRSAQRHLARRIYQSQTPSNSSPASDLDIDTSKQPQPPPRESQRIIALRIRRLPEKRSLEFREGESAKTVQQTCGAGSLAYTRGAVRERDTACGDCKSSRPKGPFRQCVVLKGEFEGACTNCSYAGSDNRDLTRCTLQIEERRIATPAEEEEEEEEEDESSDSLDSWILMTFRKKWSPIRK